MLTLPTIQKVVNEDLWHCLMILWKAVTIHGGYARKMSKFGFLFLVAPCFPKFDPILKRRDVMYRMRA